MLRNLSLRRARRALERGAERLARGETSGAAESYEEALVRLGDWDREGAPEVAGLAAEALVGRGRAYLFEDGAHTALDCFERARIARPDWWEPHYRAGCASGHVRDWPQAVACFTAALRYGPGTVPDANGAGGAGGAGGADGAEPEHGAPPGGVTAARVRVQRAYAYERQGLTDEARADLWAAVAEEPLAQEARWTLAVLELRAGAWASAEGVLRGLVDPASPRGPQAVGMLAYAMERQGQAEKALASYRQAMDGGLAASAENPEGAESPDDTVLFRHGLVAYRLGRYDDAVASWTLLHARHPHRARLRLLVARATYAAAHPHVVRKDFEAALGHLARAETLWPEGPPEGFGAAVTELHLYAAWRAAGRRDEPGRKEARWHLGEAYRRDPDDPRTHRHLAPLTFLAGERERAAQWWEGVLRRVPGDPDARFALAVCRATGERADGAELRAATRELELLSAGVTAGQPTPSPTPTPAQGQGQGQDRRVDDGTALRAARALAAVYARAGEWGEAVHVLEALPPEPGADALLAECLYRGGRYHYAPDGRLSAALGPWWRAAALCREGRLDLVRKALRHTPPRGAERAARELALLLREKALSAVTVAVAEERDGRTGEDGWREAASLLALAGGIGGPSAGAGSGVVADASVLLRGGRRGEAVTELAAACGADPGDHRAAHMLGLALLHGLSDGTEGADGTNGADGSDGSDGADGSDGSDEAREDWERCVAVWATVLHSDTFWADFRTRAERRYGTPVQPAHMEPLRGAYRQLLEERLPHAGGNGAGGLRLLFQREAEAAHALKEFGGFPPPRTGEAPVSGGVAGERAPAPLVCGPLRLAQLGLHAEFGAFLAERNRAASTSAGSTARHLLDRLREHGSLQLPGSGPSLADLTELLGSSGARQVPSELRQLFSQLGGARVQFTAGQLKEALETLSDLRCPECRARRTRAAGDTGMLGCDADCPRFDANNPGYADAAVKRASFNEAARALAAETLLGLGLNALTGSEPDLATAGRHWREAEQWGAADTRTSMAEMAIGRAESLTRSRKLDEAVAVLDLAHGLLRGAERERVQGRLASALTDRGVTSANKDIERLERPTADLRRAADLNPHLLRAQINLGLVLRAQGVYRARDGRVAESVQLLQETVDRMTAALRHNGPHHELEDILGKTTADLSVLLTRFGRR